MAFLSAYLPGRRFYIWIGWTAGVIFTKNPRIFTEFKTWRSTFAVFAIDLTSWITTHAVDFFVNKYVSELRGFNQWQF